MEIRGALLLRKRQVLILFVLLGLSQAHPESVSYSVAEETEIGSLVANMARDLGLGVEELSSREARVVFDDNEKHLHLDLLTGDLLINDKLDREELCGSTESCVMHFQMVLENPLQFFQAELHIKDINDHSPTFLDNEIVIKISESTTIGTTFLMESAQDLDVGSNSLQNYTVSPNYHFYIKIQDSSDGKIYPVLVLHRALDHEEEPELILTLVALDGGNPPRSGTTLVLIKVLDINDNAPEFLQRLYEVQILENTPVGSWIITVSAKDLDAGNYGKILLPFAFLYEFFEYGKYACCTGLHGFEHSDCGVMVVHSEDDTVVPIRCGYDTYHEQFSESDRFMFIRYTNRGHDVYKKRSGSLDEELFSEIVLFLDRYIIK